MARSQSVVGDTNRNGQRLIKKTDTPGNDHMQYVWVVRCTRVDANNVECGYQYGVNGSDFFQRKCPMCQDGRPGLPIP